jgi:hypothetical protein
MSKPQVAILAIAVLVAGALVVVAIMRLASGSTSSSSPSPKSANATVTGPLSTPIPSAGAVTLVAVNQISVYAADASAPNAPKKTIINVTVVPGADFASGNLVFAFYPDGGGASIAPDVQSSPSGATFNPSSSGAQTFNVSFSVPATTFAGTFVVSLSPGGPELLRKPFSWMMIVNPPTASISAQASASASSSASSSASPSASVSVSAPTPSASPTT